MSDDNTISLLLWCRRDQQSDALRVQVIRVDTGEEVRLKDGGFLLRISYDTDPLVMRCLIRHIASGRESRVQTGTTMQDFIKACLLENTDIFGTSEA